LGSPNGCNWDIFCLFLDKLLFHTSIFSWFSVVLLLVFARVCRRRTTHGDAASRGCCRMQQKSNGTKHKNANIAMEVVRQGVFAQQVAGMCAIFRRTAFVGVHVHAHKVGRRSRNHHRKPRAAAEDCGGCPRRCVLSVGLPADIRVSTTIICFLFPDCDFDSFTE
jgi:hypothetical protein